MTEPTAPLALSASRTWLDETGVRVWPKDQNQGPR